MVIISGVPIFRIFTVVHELLPLKGFKINKMHYYQVTEKQYFIKFITNMYQYDKQGPVVQSIVSLTSSLRGQLVKCFTTL